MSKARTWVLGVVALILVIVIAGYMLGISPLVDQVSVANQATQTTQLNNQGTQAKLVALKTQFASLGKLRKSLDKLRLSIPEQQAAAAFMNELTSLSETTGVIVQTVTLADAIVYAAPSDAPSSTTGTSTTATATPTASPSVAAPAPAAPPAAAPGVLVYIPVVVGVQGSFEQVREFVGALQSGERLFFSDSTTLTTDVSTGTVTGTMNGNIYTLAGTSDTASTKLPSTTYSTSTPTATATPTPTGTATTSSSTNKAGSKTGSDPAPTTSPTTDPDPDPTDTSTPGP